MSLTTPQGRKLRRLVDKLVSTSIENNNYGGCSLKVGQRRALASRQLDNYITQLLTRRT